MRTIYECFDEQTKQAVRDGTLYHFNYSGDSLSQVLQGGELREALKADFWKYLIFCPNRVDP